MTTPPAPPSRLYTYVLDPLEKAGSTFAEQFAVYLLPLLVVVNGKIAITGSQLLAVTDTSAFAALVSLITTVLTFALVIKSPWVDLAWRVGKTYLQSFVALITTAEFVPSVLHINWPVALLGAVPVAGAALVKGILGLISPWSQLAGLVPMVYSKPQVAEHKGEHERPRDAPTPTAFRDLEG